MMDKRFFVLDDTQFDKFIELLEECGEETPNLNRLLTEATIFDKEDDE